MAENTTPQAALLKNMSFPGFTGFDPLSSFYGSEFNPAMSNMKMVDDFGIPNVSGLLSGGFQGQQLPQGMPAQGGQPPSFGLLANDAPQGGGTFAQLQNFLQQLRQHQAQAQPFRPQPAAPPPPTQADINAMVEQMVQQRMAQMPQQPTYVPDYDGP